MKSFILLAISELTQKKFDDMSFTINYNTVTLNAYEEEDDMKIGVHIVLADGGTSRWVVSKRHFDSAYLDKLMTIIDML